MLERLQKPQNVLATASIAYGVYSALKGARNIANKQGCYKCELTGAVLGLGLAGLAGWVLLRR